MSTSATRMRELRRRQRKGLAQYRIEANEHGLAGALIASERLTPEQALRRNLVERVSGAIDRDGSMWYRVGRHVSNSSHQWTAR